MSCELDFAKNAWRPTTSTARRSSPRNNEICPFSHPPAGVSRWTTDNCPDILLRHPEAAFRGQDHVSRTPSREWSKSLVKCIFRGLSRPKNMPRACREYALTRLQGAKGTGWLAKELAQGARSLGLVSTTEGRRKDLSVSKCFLTTYDTTLFPVCEETQDPCPCVCAQCFYCVVVCVCRSQTPMMLQ